MLRAIYHAIRHEFGLKVISVVAAISLWVYVMNHEDPIRHETYDRRVEVVGVPSGLVVARVLPERVRVTVTGRLSSLQRGAMDSMRVVADASRGTEGRVQAELHVVGLPERVKVQYIERSTAQVFLDREATITCRVRAVVRGGTDKALELARRLQVRPTEVMVSGPAQSLQRLETVIARVEQNALVPGQAVSRPLEALDADGQTIRGLVFKPAMVLVELPDEQTATREVPIEVDLGSAPPGMTVLQRKVSPSRVTIRGKPDAIRDISAVHTERQDISGLRGSRTWTARLALPPGITTADGVDAVTLQVTVGGRSGAAQPRPETAAPAPATPSGQRPEEAPAPEGTEARPTKPPEGGGGTPPSKEGSPPSASTAPAGGGHSTAGTGHPQPPPGTAGGDDRRKQEVMGPNRR